MQSVLQFIMILCLFLQKQYSKREQDNSKKALEDYIQQQRSYYAEIDAFELPEEEVDSTAALDWILERFLIEFPLVKDTSFHYILDIDTPVQINSLQQIQ